jgi:hypothetical protein
MEAHRRSQQGRGSSPKWLRRRCADAALQLLTRLRHTLLRQRGSSRIGRILTSCDLFVTTRRCRRAKRPEFALLLPPPPLREALPPCARVALIDMVPFDSLLDAAIGASPRLGPTGGWGAMPKGEPQVFTSRRAWPAPARQGPKGGVRALKVMTAPFTNHKYTPLHAAMSGCRHASNV